MDKKDLTIHIATSSILKIVGIVLLLFFVYYIGDILLLIFISIIFAAVIEPLVNWLAKNKIPRSLGVILIYIGLALLVSLVIRLMVPPIIDQISYLAQNFPAIWEKFLAYVSALEHYSQSQIFVDNVQQALTSLLSGLQLAAGGAYGFIMAVFQNIINFITVLVLTYYFAVKNDSVANTLRLVIPDKYETRLDETVAAIKSKIGDWARGQLLLGLIIGFFSFIGLMFLLPQYALVLAIIAGLTEMIPYIGPILGAIPAVFLGFLTPAFSLTRGLAVLVLYVIIQQLEGNIIVPQVMKKSVGLNPVVVIIVILIGARVAGIIGIILSIPVTVALGVVAKDFLAKQQLKQLQTDLDRS